VSIQKRILLTALVAFSVLLLAIPAFGATGTGGYVAWTAVSSLPGQGTSPHGGYATSTVKCAVCHAVHNASLSGQLLLQTPASDACNYCHVGGAGGYTQVYNGIPANYSGTDWKNAHNSFLVAGVEGGLVCTTCHQVHAADQAMTANAALTVKLLKGAKVYDDSSGTPNYDPVAKAPLAGDSYDVALTKWCAGCHFTRGGTYTYYANAYNQQSHVMTNTAAVYDNPSATYNGQVAWIGSTYCSSCHASNYNDGTGKWPHYTAGNRFLISSTDASSASVPTTNTSSDGVCLRCHRQSTKGIGLTF
jgi:hypothetical protein